MLSSMGHLLDTLLVRSPDLPFLMSQRPRTSREASASWPRHRRDGFAHLSGTRVRHRTRAIESSCRPRQIEQYGHRPARVCVSGPVGTPRDGEGCDGLHRGPAQGDAQDRSRGVEPPASIPRRRPISDVANGHHQYSWHRTCVNITLDALARRRQGRSLRSKSGWGP